MSICYLLRLFLRSRKKSAEVYLPISIGEAVDRLTILELKLEAIGPTRDLSIPIEDLKYQLRWVLDDPLLNELVTGLRKVNKILWGLEDDARRTPRENETRCCEIAGGIWDYNGCRAELKRELDAKTSSLHADKKQYASRGLG